MKKREDQGFTKGGEKRSETSMETGGVGKHQKKRRETCNRKQKKLEGTGRPKLHQEQKVKKKTWAKEKTKPEKSSKTCSNQNGGRTPHTYKKTGPRTVPQQTQHKCHKACKKGIWGKPEK